jgi:hypothetical protein
MNSSCNIAIDLRNVKRSMCPRATPWTPRYGVSFLINSLPLSLRLSVSWRGGCCRSTAGLETHGTAVEMSPCSLLYSSRNVYIFFTLPLQPGVCEWTHVMSTCRLLQGAVCTLSLERDRDESVGITRLLPQGLAERLYAGDALDSTLLSSSSYSSLALSAGLWSANCLFYMKVSPP